MIHSGYHPANLRFVVIVGCLDLRRNHNSALILIKKHIANNDNFRIQSLITITYSNYYLHNIVQRYNIIKLLIKSL